MSEKNDEIVMCLGAWAETADKFIGIDVTLGPAGLKIGEIISTEVVDGMVMATVAVKDEEADRVRAFLVELPDLLKPKIEANLSFVPAVPKAGEPGERGKG